MALGILTQSIIDGVVNEQRPFGRCIHVGARACVYVCFVCVRLCVHVCVCMCVNLRVDVLYVCICTKSKHKTPERVCGVIDLMFHFFFN